MIPSAEQLLARARRTQRRALPSTNRRIDATASHGEQRILSQLYRAAATTRGALPSFADAEFRDYSQNGEDGILLLLTSILEPPRRIVEIGAADGIECNAANLILHQGWSGLLIDGDERLVERGVRFYAGQPETFRIGPTLVHAWVTAENAKALLAQHGFDREVGVLSVDLDGVDLWVLKAIKPTASVLVVEFNARLPAEIAVTVPYREDFTGDGDKTRGEGYFGASLLAFVRMLRPFGYRLVGANSISTNAFFVRDELGIDLLPEVSPAACQASAWARTMSERWWPVLQSREWAEVK